MYLTHKIFAPLKKALPQWLSMPIRSFFTAILTPVYFSWNTGHLISSFKNKAVNKKGSPLAWYAYSMIYFLQNKDIKKRSICEFGSGQSTLWWGSRAEKVVSFEEDKNWYAYIKALSTENISIYHVENLEECSKYLKEELFDIVIIDGPDRFKASEMSLLLIKSDGAIILDDADSNKPIVDLFRTKGFSRIDFCGYAPGVILPRCTSLFFKKECFLLSGLEDPVMRMP